MLISVRTAAVACEERGVEWGGVVVGGEATRTYVTDKRTVSRRIRGRRRAWE